MKLFNKSNKKNNETHRLPMGNKSKRALAMRSEEHTSELQSH